MTLTNLEFVTGHVPPPNPWGRAGRVGAAAIALWLTLLTPAGAAVGDLDGQFGQGGQLQVAGNAGPSVLELPDGRILVVGRHASSPSASASSREVAINRYLASGVPDASFGQDGQVVVTLPVDSPAISAIALQPDGRVVMAGSYWAGGGRPFVARVDANGTLDRSFGTDGISEPGTGGTEPFYSSLLVMSDGEILASISDWTSDRLDRFAADGRPLGNLSWAIAPARMAFQSDGRLIVSGYHRTLKKSVVMRLDTDGRVDPTFGQGGFAELEAGYSSKLSVEPGSDRIVLCGPGVVRLTSDGHADTTFGLQGTGYVAFGRDAVPTFDFCNRVLATRRRWGCVHRNPAGPGGRRLRQGLRRRVDVERNGGHTRWGRQRCREINLGDVQGSRDLWQDYSSAFIATRNGDALLTWLTASDAVLKLARIDLGSGTAGGVDPPVSTPTPTPAPAPAPTPAPTPSPTAHGGGGSGGGGAIGWPELALFAFGFGVVARSRRAVGLR